MRSQILFIIQAVLFLATISWIGLHGPVGRGGYPLIAVYVLAHLLMVGLWWTWPFARRTVFVIILLGVAARVLMFPFPLCDDANRYVWEGQIQNAGYNPFALAPDADELSHLRDENWKGINQKPIPAIYPPLAQYVFRLCHTLYPDGRFFRLVFTLFDLGILLVLIRLAVLFKLERKHLLLYALNPHVLLFIAGEGHLDPMYLFMFMAAILAWMRQREGIAFFLLGMACMMKIIPLAFIPLMVRRHNLNKAWLCLIPFLLYIPFAGKGVNLLAVPLQHAGTFFYNSGLFSIYSAFLSNHAASALCWITFIVIAGFIFFLVPNLFRSCFLLAGAYLLCSPTAHQWYFLLIVPFLPFFRSMPWLMLLALMSATFATRVFQYETGGWVDYPLARCIEYIPFAVLGILGLVMGRRTGPELFENPRGLSVLVPVLNEATQIEDCLRSVKDQAFENKEIIVIDGGSTDGTQEKVSSMENVLLLESYSGRGAQIARGVESAQKNVVMVLHADSRLEPGVLNRLMAALEKVPQSIGGSLGSSYEEPSIKYTFIAFLDNCRALLTGVSFGNQGQFFRINHLKGAFPTYRLMEDVELAFRMKESGALLFLPRGIRNGTRRWRSVGYLKNSLMVIRLVFRFVVLRRLGILKGDLDDFYKKYYGGS